MQTILLKVKVSIPEDSKLIMENVINPRTNSTLLASTEFCNVQHKQVEVILVQASEVVVNSYAGTGFVTSGGNGWVGVRREDYVATCYWCGCGPLKQKFGGHDRDLDSDSEYGEYPWDVGELAKVEGDTDYVDLFKII